MKTRDINRRDFLKTAAGGTSGLTAASILAPVGAAAVPGEGWLQHGAG
ncbi:MAG: twin-arginine translocation signal domain-containing protein [Fidelibacterota bacterium]|nr:MAG: twin-arginine translocation signal domain-containing protein [Candidatus Neomarinimicrobiota bacterium]